MSTSGTKCQFCRQRYIRASAYEKHLQSHHAEHYEDLYRLKPDSSGPRPSSVDFNHDSAETDVLEYPGYNESDYESDSADCELENASDGEEDPGTSTTSQSHIRCKVEAYENAGCPIADISRKNNHEEGLLTDPWRPFHTLDDFKLANWFITSKVPRSRIDEYFSIGLAKSSSPCFRSAYKLDQFINGLDPYRHFLEWHEGTYTHDGNRSTFFYRDIVQSVEYLLSQPAYREDVVYVPVREYDEAGERLYSEMHMGNWWWETQVGGPPASDVGLGKMLIWR
jgi:hypothetical protein